MFKALVSVAGVIAFNSVLAGNCPLLPDESITDGLLSAHSSGASPAGHRLQGDKYSVTWRFAPASPAIGEHFNVLGRVCRNDGEIFTGSVKVNATMPRHGHGMNYVSSSQMFANGQFVTSGMLLHMPGQWAVELTVIDGAGREKMQFDYQAKR